MNCLVEEDARLGVSSEQSGEALHSRLQRVRNMLFKTSSDNKLFGQRLVDRVVAYNWDLHWDGAQCIDKAETSSSTMCLAHSS